MGGAVLEGAMFVGGLGWWLAAHRRGHAERASRGEDPEARALAGLDGTLLEAHHLVMSCQSQRRGLTSQLLSASRQAKRFRDVHRKIDTYLSLIPVIIYIGIARRLDGNPSSCSQSLLEESGGAEDREFRFAEIAVATNNFAVVLSDDADSGTKVYKGQAPQRH
ncbi:unnamed protein product [Miscanthus lutarioriparius]|uniref:Uncharacterized protein n=1 Tax=Miscanthus lutarioriparius TaxID=422564 RepID=A0A811QRQ4_9POAL|nr:unnamed protein product [Miscanthus lutarioriparius]